MCTFYLYFVLILFCFLQPMIEDFGSLNVTAALRSVSSITSNGFEEENETVSGAAQDSKILNKGSSGSNGKDGKY